MSRRVPEWVGKTDDTPVPPRVKIRVLDRYFGLCDECTWPIGDSKWTCDHRVAIINGGENRERNLRPICIPCNKEKNKLDMEIKSKITRIRKRHLGLRKAKGRPLPGTKASGIRKRFDGTVERR